MNIKRKTTQEHTEGQLQTSTKTPKKPKVTKMISKYKILKEEKLNVQNDLETTQSDWKQTQKYQQTKCLRWEKHNLKEKYKD